MTSTTQAPRLRILFAGHLVDAPGRDPPRFPESMTGAAGARIEEELTALGAGKGDLGLTQGAAGGDLLFARCVLARGMELQLLQPFEEARFVEESVASRGPAWLTLYNIIKGQLRPDRPILAAPAVLGNLKDGENEWERCNRWLIDVALSDGAARMALMVLWNGARGDGPGGTANMVERVGKQGCRMIWIDTRTL